MNNFFGKFMRESTIVILYVVMAMAVNALLFLAFSKSTNAVAVILTLWIIFLTGILVFAWEMIKWKTKVPARMTWLDIGLMLVCLDLSADMGAKLVLIYFNTDILMAAMKYIFDPLMILGMAIGLKGILSRS